ncbi:hypothetical protein RQP53_16420 [Paucibacter sp. APW11]|uniref:Response regulatory domain-containing protein n=1 Tax=Roseateles aquae TaxID=3077235 RepID=A0ABU3PFB7_9BURK|nr:hypothetical protein [Paucibacter sp. APW11]MDT9000862.1 hypothetical protein [Paucibacter sp. APW11]
MSTVFLLRHSLQTLAKTGQALAQEGSWRLCGEAHLIEDAWPLLRLLQPELLVCDLRLIDGHSLRLLRRMRAQTLRCRVLLLSACADDLLLFETLASGAHGYHIECARGPTLGDSLLALQQGRAVMSPALARQLLARFGLKRSSIELAQSPLAGRDREPAGDTLMRQCERHLLSLVAHGLLVGEVAQRWQLGREQVELRLGKLYERLHGLLAVPGTEESGDQGLKSTISELAELLP